MSKRLAVACWVCVLTLWVTSVMAHHATVTISYPSGAATEKDAVCLVTVKNDLAFAGNVSWPYDPAIDSVKFGWWDDNISDWVATSAAAINGSSPQNWAGDVNCGTSGTYLIKAVAYAGSMAHASANKGWGKVCD